MFFKLVDLPEAIQFKSFFIVYPHINTTYKGKTLKSLVPIPIGLIGNVIIIVTLVLRNKIGELKDLEGVQK